MGAEEGRRVRGRDQRQGVYTAAAGQWCVFELGGGGGWGGAAYPCREATRLVAPAQLSSRPHFKASRPPVKCLDRRTRHHPSPCFESLMPSVPGPLALRDFASLPVPGTHNFLLGRHEEHSPMRDGERPRWQAGRLEGRGWKAALWHVVGRIDVTTGVR